MSLAALRAKKKDSLAILQKKVASEGKGGYEKDEGFWSPTVDKAGNGSAVFRFLPAHANDDLPYISYYHHAFKGATGQWYMEMSRTTLGSDEPDPVSEMNSKLWAQGENSQGRKLVQGGGKDQPGRKRKLTYIANIFIIDDKGNADNNGRVFKYKFGKQVFDIIKDAMYPQEAFGEEPLDPFDIDEGANLHLKIRNKDGYRNFEKSEFAKVGPLFKDDVKLEAVINQTYPLQEIIAPEKFKSYDELTKKLARVLGTNPSNASGDSLPEEDAEELPQAREKPAGRKPAGEDDGDADRAFFEQFSGDND